MNNVLHPTTSHSGKVLRQLLRKITALNRWWPLLAVAMLAGGLQHASGVTLAWDRAASHTNLSAYLVKYGIASGSYTGVVSVAGSQTTATLNNLVPGLTYYFVVAAKNQSSVESDASNQIAYTVPGNVAAPGLRVRKAPSGQVVLTVTGQASKRYEILASQNFTTWSVINAVTLGTSGTTDVVDANAASFPRRFYRVRTQ